MATLPNDSSPDLIEAVNEAIISRFFEIYTRDETIVRRVRDAEDELLTLSEAAALLKCSENALRKEIKDGTWKMIIGVGGQYVMTRRDFRIQRDLRFAIERRGF